MLILKILNDRNGQALEDNDPSKDFQLIQVPPDHVIEFEQQVSFGLEPVVVATIFNPNDWSSRLQHVLTGMAYVYSERGVLIATHSPIPAGPSKPAEQHAD